MESDSARWAQEVGTVGKAAKPGSLTQGQGSPADTRDELQMAVHKHLVFRGGKELFCGEGD